MVFLLPLINFVRMRLLLLLLGFMNGFALWAQSTEEKLAAQFFAGKEYGKAAEIYEDLASKQPESVYYYENLLQCYILIPDFKSADKLTEKRMRKFPDMPAYKVDKAYLCHLQGKLQERDLLFKELLKAKPADADFADLLANAFIRRKFYEQAAETYLNARRELKDRLLFAYSLSELYFYSSKIREGTEELLLLAGSNEFLLEDIRNRLVLAYASGDQYKILSSLLLEKLQKEPGSYVYNDLLVWSFTQQKDWEGAFQQCRAVDKRLKEDGRKLLELAQVLVSNDEYEYALRCFEHVKSLGSEKRYFYQAQQGVLNCGMLQLKAGRNTGRERLLSMESEYLGFLQNNGFNWQTAPQIKELSELYIYYLHQPDKASDILNRVISLPGLDPRLQAECKLALGDAWLIRGETWEADLLYKQVEKAFANDALGQEAKFRYARLCYFRGEFDWSRTQLDVLKDATTQLISNNALRLWLTIQDNTGLDSTEDALRLFAEAELLIFQNRPAEALKKLEELPVLFPGHTLTDEIYFARALIAEQAEQYAEAEKFYKKVIAEYSFDILADNALIHLARLYEFKLNDTALARKTYEIIVFNYSGSLYISEARKRYRLLRGDMLREGELSN